MPPKHHHKHHGHGEHPSPPGSPHHKHKHHPPHSPPGSPHHKHKHHHEHSPPPSPGSPGRHHHHHDHHHHPPHHHDGHGPPPPPIDGDGPPVPPPEGAPPPPERQASEEEKKDNHDDDEDDIDVTNLNLNDDEVYAEEEQAQPAMGSTGGSSSSKKQSKKNLFKLSAKFGGGGANAFDHGNNRHIDKLVIYADNHIVHGMEVTYAMQNKPKMVGRANGKATTYNFDQNEFITWAKVRSNRYVQCLTFRTNRGKTIGPCGGNGWNGMLKKDPEGKEVTVPAPMKRQLCGFKGSSGHWLDAIQFRWGPPPGQGQQ